jgi:hypothetical protein
MDNWSVVKPAMCAKWLVLPTVYSDALSYGEQIDKFCYQLNKLIENNNLLPDYIAEMIEKYITSGAIGEVVRDILANYILNVKYPPEGITPAVGDGSADDTAAIQGCIDYASANGGVVYFPYGSYLSQPLTMKNGVSLFGFDRYSTKIVLKGGATKALINGNVSDLSVVGLTVDGNSGVQVNDVDVVNVTGSNVMFNELIIKDGYNLFSFVGDGHLQCDNIIFGNAVENCFSVDGNVVVQAKNMLFTNLSKVGGVSVIDIKANGGNYDFNSVADCDTCLMISGNDNKISAMISRANEDYADTGLRNNICIAGKSNKEFYSGNVNVSANDFVETLQGNKTENVTGDITVTGKNSETTLSGNKTENVTGDITVTGKNSETTLSGNKTENVTGDITVTGKNLETDVDGNYSRHVDGVSSINNGGAVTEVNASSKRVSVNGTYTGEYNGNATLTFKNKLIANMVDATFTGINFVVNAFMKIKQSFTGVDNNEWVKNHRSNPYTNVTILSASGDGKAAVSGFSRTQDNPNTYDQITMGIQGIAQSDDSSKPNVPSWGGYFENRYYAGGSVFGVEIDNGRMGSNPKDFKPYDAFTLNDMCVGLNLSSGLGLDDEESLGSDTAIIIHANPKPFNQGIVFQNNSIKENNPFIFLPWGGKIAWQLGNLDSAINQYMTGSSIKLSDVANTPLIETAAFKDYNLNSGLDDGDVIYMQNFKNGNNVAGKLLVKNQGDKCTFFFQIGNTDDVFFSVNRYAAMFPNMQVKFGTLATDSDLAQGSHTTVAGYLPITVGSNTYYIPVYS